ncbi:hypothetical protein PSHT_10716, partial [Puccinia striiformis]
MKWLDRSEVELIRILWPSEIEALDETLSDLLRLMNTPSEIRKNQQFHPIGWSKGRAPLRQVGFDLALSLSPTIKLSRFISTPIESYQINSSFLHLSSSQLQFLSESIQNIRFETITILSHLSNIDIQAHQPISTTEFTEAIGRLSSMFQSYLFIILLYIIPIIPENDKASYPTQTALRDWFVTWFNLFSLSIQHLDDAATFYDGTVLYVFNLTFATSFNL